MRPRVDVYSDLRSPHEVQPRLGPPRLLPARPDPPRPENPQLRYRPRLRAVRDDLLLDHPAPREHCRNVLLEHPVAAVRAVDVDRPVRLVVRLLHERGRVVCEAEVEAVAVPPPLAELRDLLVRYLPRLHVGENLAARPDRVAHQLPPPLDRILRLRLHRLLDERLAKPLGVVREDVEERRLEDVLAGGRSRRLRVHPGRLRLRRVESVDGLPDRTAAQHRLAERLHRLRVELVQLLQPQATEVPSPRRLLRLPLRRIVDAVEHDPPVAVECHESAVLAELPPLEKPLLRKLLREPRDALLDVGVYRCLQVNPVLAARHRAYVRVHHHQHRDEVPGVRRLDGRAAAGQPQLLGEPGKPQVVRAVVRGDDQVVERARPCKRGRHTAY